MIAGSKDILIGLCPKQIRLPLRYHYWKYRGKLEKELLLLKQLVGKGRRAIDIGANEGIYSYALSKLCEVVEVFEPQPWCAEIISAYSKYRKRNINVYSMGLSEFNGSLILNIPIIDGKPKFYLATFRDLDSEKSCIEIPVARLDDYNFTEISFIKIDVEGHESEVLKGARETILREKPVLLIEIEQRHLGRKPMEVVFSEITELGYEGSFLYQGIFLALDEFSYDIYQKQFIENASQKDFENKLNREYVNNFIFKPL